MVGRYHGGNAIIILGHPDMGFLMPTAVTYASSWSAGRQTLEAARRRLAPDPSARLWTNSIGTTRGLQMAAGFASCSGCAGDPKGERARVRPGDPEGDRALGEDVGGANRKRLVRQRECAEQCGHRGGVMPLKQELRPGSWILRRSPFDLTEQQPTRDRALTHVQPAAGRPRRWSVATRTTRQQ
jgi:hypothetical protein